MPLDDTGDLLLEGVAFRRIDHGDEIGEALDGFDNIAAVAPAFAGGTVPFNLKQRGPKVAQRLAGNVDPLIDGQSGHFLPAAFSKDARLARMHAKVLVVHDEFCAA